MSLPIPKLRLCLSYSMSKFYPFLPNPSSFSSFHLHYHSQPPSPDHDNVHDVVSQFRRMFHMRPIPPIYAFGQILGSLTRMKHYSTTISLFKQMELNGIKSHLVILNIVINCFCHLGQMPFSFSILAKILKRGYHPSVITLNTLMKGLCLNGEVKKALTFRDKVVAQGFLLNEFSYGTLINGLCKIGE
ncbi:putative pentatricopeptide repeat-containing protein At1g12700, mitochondrial, partial [Vigna umbellata]|uniref:putative pentatricopeptide repeat-containing protein At1g12700, mitochondrial n=1 Tax=Vigna umbellata TaxID=87088 RepID=UPI001F5F096E